MYVRVHDRDRFPTSMDDLKNRDGSIRFIYRNGMWFLGVTTREILKERQSIVKAVEDSVMNKCNTTDFVPARVVSCDPGKYTI